VHIAAAAGAVHAVAEPVATEYAAALHNLYYHACAIYVYIYHSAQTYRTHIFILRGCRV
jgi:hypothetical protein